VAAFAVVLLTGAPAPSSAETVIHDAEKYCSSIGNDDTIREIPHSLVNKVRKIIEWTDADDEQQLLSSTAFRCTDGKVLVCNSGANLICDKPDTRVHRKEVDAFCKDNPNEDIVPRAVTGHATIYSWRCFQGKPIITHAQGLDARGFSESMWRTID
jgi:hypothetical protein